MWYAREWLRMIVFTSTLDAFRSWAHRAYIATDQGGSFVEDSHRNRQRWRITLEPHAYETSSLPFLFAREMSRGYLYAIVWMSRRLAGQEGLA